MMFTAERLVDEYGSISLGNLLPFNCSLEDNNTVLWITQYKMLPHLPAIELEGPAYFLPNLDHILDQPQYYNHRFSFDLMMKYILIVSTFS